MLPMSTAKTLSRDVVEDTVEEGVHVVLLHRTSMSQKRELRCEPVKRVTQKEREPRK